MNAFIFQSNDEQLALVDIHSIVNADFCNIQECITVGFNSGERVSVRIENKLDRASEFLRLTTAIQEDQYKEENECAVVWESLTGKTH